ncbi:hypothetical protein ACFJIX_22590 [Roseateles sp. UC29_93]|uniref:hypothetical protein n=1 Tax=Roseateles sp. UC29_93 TaxID=3350177 RepID=UPI00366B5203
MLRVSWEISSCASWRGSAAECSVSVATERRCSAMEGAPPAGRCASLDTELLLPLRLGVSGVMGMCSPLPCGSGNRPAPPVLFVDDVRLRTFGADWRGAEDGRERTGAASAPPSLFAASTEERREDSPSGTMCSLEGLSCGSTAGITGSVGVCGPDSVSADGGGTLIARPVGMVLLMTP